MNHQVVGIFIQEAGRLLSGLIGLYTPNSMRPAPPKDYETISFQEEEVPQEPILEEPAKKGVACLPCTNSHLLTCRGLLDEAHRMSHEGLTPDGMERVDQCLGEIAAAERVDLAPSNIAKLPPDEQEIARYAATEIRNIRHDLEQLADPRVLESAAARTTDLQKRVSAEYVKVRLNRMDPTTRANFEKKVKERIAQVDKELADKAERPSN